ncbi:hypothetical protein ACJMK2_025356 [Sinanodonta woodiana]|uniref:Uncharacterized protein n=1 Tax=Sinanodonta woodiana TaxID=1069815 RepID=A0ABD3XG95_SINWO
MNRYHVDTLLALSVLIFHVLVTNCQNDAMGGMGEGGSNAGGMGPFSSAGNGGGAFGGGNGLNSNGNQANGKGASPFAMAAGNTGKGGGGPFSAAAGDGQNGQGANPFQIATDNNGPFKASSQLEGVDMGTNIGGMSSGPGGLAGGAFVTDNNSGTGNQPGLNSGTDTYNGASKPNNGATSGQSNTGEAGLDNSRFDTGEYQQMVQDMFKPDNFDQQLVNSNPFDGKVYGLPNYGNAGSSSSEGGKTQYNTAKDSSVGSFANMDVSSTNQQNQYGDKYNGKQTNFMKDDNNAMANTNSGNGNFGSGQGNNDLLKTPFSIDTGAGNKNNDNTNGNGAMKNPFDISGMDNAMHGQSDTSNGGDTMGNYNSDSDISNQYKDNGLDEFGNVHFSELPANGGKAGIFGQQNSGSSGSLNLGDTPFKIQESSGLNQAMSQQVAYNDDYNTGAAGNKFGTPFGTSDDNDLYRTPFKSEAPNAIYGPNMSPSGFGGNSGNNGPMNLAGNPGGNPFSQGGTSMGMNSMPRAININLNFKKKVFPYTWYFQKWQHSFNGK